MHRLFKAGLWALTLVSTMAFADTAETSISITISNNDVDWCNLQHPGSGDFIAGDAALGFETPAPEATAFTPLSRNNF